MTTTNTMDVEATVKQVFELVKSGCSLVRLATRNMQEALQLEIIKNKLHEFGIDVPLIVDVHYNPEVAIIAAQFVEKIRINPGNYIPEEVSSDIEITNRELSGIIFKNLDPLIQVCTKNNTVIRIGVNHGSLSKRILHKYGNTPMGMVESLMEFVNVFKQEKFDNLVLSVKASDVSTMIEANLLLVERLVDEGLSYPIHLGVTEAGNDIEGRIASSIGIGYLLKKGIGDTIRVSLTENPVNEVVVANKLVESFGRTNSWTPLIDWKYVSMKMRLKIIPTIITKGKSSISDLSYNDLEFTNELSDDLQKLAICNYPGLSFDELMLVASVDISSLLLDENAEGICINNSEATTDDQNAQIIRETYQSLDLRVSNTKYVACPTCGRSTVNVAGLLSEIKKATKGYPGLKIGVMGCNVNGPGEMTGADFGIVGAGLGKVDVYVNGKVKHRGITEEIAPEMLNSVILEAQNKDSFIKNK